MKSFILSLLIFISQITARIGPDKIAPKSNDIQICDMSDFNFKGPRLGNNYYMVDEKEISNGISNSNKKIITGGIHITYRDNIYCDSISNNISVIKCNYFTSNNLSDGLDTFDLLHVIMKESHKYYCCCCHCRPSCYIIDGIPYNKVNTHLSENDYVAYNSVFIGVLAEYENLRNQSKQVEKPNTYPNPGHHTEWVFSGY